MNGSYNNQESRMKLKSWKEIRDEAKPRMNSITFPKRKTSYLKEWNQRRGSQYLSNTIKSMKVQNLVKLFVYKLRRNIATQNDKAYNDIQDTITLRIQQPKRIRSLHLNENLQAIIISLDIICILIIQTLSTFHGFYDDYIQKASTSLPIILIQIFCLAVFLVKLLMGFTTPRLTHGEKNEFMKFVAYQYITSIIFFFNLLNFIMTIFKVIFPANKAVGIVSFIISVASMPVLTQDLEIVEATWIKNFTKKQYFTMFKVLLFNLFFVQFISTMFVAISYFDYEQNWIEKAIRTGVMKPNLSWWQQYFYALYWAIVTSATIGFGDLTPANFLETGFMCILMILGTIVLSFNVSSIGLIVGNLRSVDEQRKQETMIFKRICKDEKISKGLQNKISDYIYKSAKLKAQFDFNERKAFLQKLPTQLKNDLQSEYAENIFSKIPFFRELSHQTLVNFSLKLKGQIYYPGQELIISEGKLTKIIFLKHGQIGMSYNRFGSKINGLIIQTRRIHKDSDTPFLLNKNLLSRTRKLNYQIISQTYSVMLELEYEEFFEIIKRNRKDYQLFFEISNSMSEIDEQWELFVCSQCAPKKHSAFFCPKLHYIPYKSLVIDRFLFCPSLDQPAFRDYLRKQNRMKRKSARFFWKTIYKEYERKWEINLQKQITKRSKNVVNEQLETDDISPTMHTERLLGSSKTINLAGLSEKNINEELIVRLSEKILKLHCCQLAKVDKSEQPLSMDVMYNFKNFFPRFNPSQLFKLSLKSKKRQIVTYKGPFNSDLNQYEINLKVKQ